MNGREGAASKRRAMPAVLLGTAAILSGGPGAPAVVMPVVAAEERPNPHSDLIFRATGATSCRDCHRIGKDGGLSARPIENDLVRTLRGRAKGVHGPGRFADCLRCHAGGSKGVEKN